MDLGGRWAAAEADDDRRRSFPRPELDDSGWERVTVPGHWQSEPAFAASDGPLLLRRRFECEAPLAGRRAWLVMEGVFYQSDVWLDGSYLGDTEGYFFPHEFDVTAALGARSEHLLAVEVGCERPSRSGRHALMGAWGDGECIDPSYNPGGIWAPATVVESGPVRLGPLRLICAEAGPERAVLELTAVLDSSERLTATLRTEARRQSQGDVVAAAEKQQPLAVGANRVRWRLEVAAPQLWFPAGLGEQPLYHVSVSVAVASGLSDTRTVRTGLRRVRMRDFVWAVNGERLFLKGANLVPTRRDLASATGEEVVRDVEMARRAGLNMLRARAHVARPELYRAADEAGMLIWQDMPLLGRYKGARRQAVRQAAAAVDLLGHHPSVLAWCGHADPFAGEAAVGTRPGVRRALRFAARLVLPSWNKSVLDRSIRRALDRADPSRPAMAHSGGLPHLAGGGSCHSYFGWLYGQDRDLARVAAGWPAVARFVSELGAQSVPPTAGFTRPESWPHLDWDRLVAHYCMRKDVFDDRAPPLAYAGFDAWREATQAYQADVVRCQVEALRRLRERPAGGFAVSNLNDAQEAVSCSLVDHEGRPKAAFYALRAACAPVLVVADWPAAWYRPGTRASFAVHVVNDTGEPLGDALVEAVLTWPGGGRQWRFGGVAGPGPCTFVGRVAAVLPSAGSLPGDGVDGVGAGRAWPMWPLRLQLRLQWGSPAATAVNHYESVLCERAFGAPRPAPDGRSW